MDYAERLNRIIDTVGKGYSNKGYNAFENQAELKALENSNIFFTTSVLGMKAISHVIEDQAVKLGKPFRLYSAFQKFSRVNEQRKRYLKILETKNPVYLFGIPDAPLWHDPNLIQVPLAEPASTTQPSLANNWFVVLHNPQFVSMALVTRELYNPSSSASASNKLIYRNFEGFWTYDKAAISQIVEVLDGYIKQSLG